ncbi:8822_t:CDS:1, partial [Racocetra persica]
CNFNSAIRHLMQFKASRALTAHMEPCLQSVIQSVETIPPKCNPLSPVEIKIIAQLDT